MTDLTKTNTDILCVIPTRFSAVPRMPPRHRHEGFVRWPSSSDVRRTSLQIER